MSCQSIFVITPKDLILSQLRMLSQYAFEGNSERINEFVWITNALGNWWKKELEGFHSNQISAPES